MSPAKRLRFATILIVVGCLAGMAISFRAWVSPGTLNRSFPLIPVIEGFPTLSNPWDLAHACMAVALLASASIWIRLRLLKVAAIVAAGLMILLDQSRLQPWLYQYLMMLGAMALCRPKSPCDERFTIGTLRLIIICMYIYSGLHKFNLSFVNESVPLMLKPLRDLLHSDALIQWLGWPMAGTETLLGILLAWRRTRPLGVILAMLMHLTILLLIGPLGSNYNHVVWPWNLTMIALDWSLFWPGRRGAAPMQSLLSKARKSQGVFNAPIPVGIGAQLARVTVIILAAVVPVGGLFGWVDGYLSWAMYAGAPPLAAVKMSDGVIATLPDPIRGRVQDMPRTGKAIEILDWSLDDLRLPYPEEHFYWRVAKELAEYSRGPSDMALVIIHAPPRWSIERTKEEFLLSPTR